MLIIWIGFAYFSRTNDTDVRFGSPLSARAVAALPPGVRLRRVQVELERRISVHQTLGSVALPLLVLARQQEDAFDGNWLINQALKHRDELKQLADAYRAIGRNDWAEILQRAALGGDPSLEAKHWVAHFNPESSRSSQTAYLEAHISEILP